MILSATRFTCVSASSRGCLPFGSADLQSRIEQDAAVAALFPFPRFARSPARSVPLHPADPRVPAPCLLPHAQLPSTSVTPTYSGRIGVTRVRNREFAPSQPMARIRHNTVSSRKMQHYLVAAYLGRLQLAVPSGPYPDAANAATARAVRATLDFRTLAAPDIVRACIVKDLSVLDPSAEDDQDLVDGLPKKRPLVPAASNASSPESSCRSSALPCTRSLTGFGHVHTQQCPRHASEAAAPASVLPDLRRRWRSSSLPLRSCVTPGELDWQPNPSRRRQPSPQLPSSFAPT